MQKEKEEGDADADGVDLEEVEPRDVASGGSIGQRVNVRRRSAIRSSSGSRADKRRNTTSGAPQIYIRGPLNILCIKIFNMQTLAFNTYRDSPAFNNRYVHGPTRALLAWSRHINT